MKYTICLVAIFFNHSISAYCQEIAKPSSYIIFQHIKGTGSPAVIFVSGLGEDHNTWQSVQDSISKYTLTVSYDRAGLGRSAYNGVKKDLGSLAEELHELIKTHAGAKPFMLVGHSLGCQIIKMYASLYPANINSIIFLDPGYDERKLRKRLPDTVWQKREQALQKYQPHYNTAQQAELDSLNTNCEIADGITFLPKVPIILFTGTDINPDFPGSLIELEVKQETHTLWLKSLPWAKQIKVTGSRHYIQNDKPGVVTDVIYKMIKQIPE
jgi:pimeloyl-ACP methyl ester carboxylesterase